MLANKKRAFLKNEEIEKVYISTESDFHLLFPMKNQKRNSY